ncbi:MAG: phosphotransferase [Trueperaceae bacterium]|nr:phosphotransferase [Trueperaceae bacterium]
MLKYWQDEHYESEERFSKRQDRKKPKGRRSITDLYVGEDAHSSADQFADSALQLLFERGIIKEILGELKSGKEATVYLADGPEGLMAAKIYSDMLVRSFRNDSMYRAGRFIGDDRIQKAIDQRTLNGINAQQGLWVFHEYLQLWELYRAGLKVPKPMVGPDASDMVDAGRVVLMEFIGTRDAAAPRLSDVRLESYEAESAWQQSLEALIQLAKMGKVHGDYSTYNLLWWQGEVIVIDFPQMGDIAENPNAMMLLERDVVSLCKTFKKHGIHENPEGVFRELRARALLSGF